MARSFDSGSSEYLEVSSAVKTAPAFTLACWFKATATSNAAVSTIMAIGGDDGGTARQYHRLFLYGTQAGDPIGAQSQTQSGGGGIAQSTAGTSADTNWHHGCAVFAATNSRTVYFDGGNSATNSSSVTYTNNPDVTSIGRNQGNSPSAVEYWDGEIAWPCIWNVALDAADAAALAAGAHPLSIRPADILAFWPLTSADEKDYIGGFDLTEGGTVSVVDNPLVSLGGAQIIPFTAAAASGVKGSVFKSVMFGAEQ